VEHLQRRFEVSERRACRVVGRPRSSQRYASVKVGKDGALVQRMVALSAENPRYGYRRVWALLGREGWAANKKRVQRLWREAGLKVPAKKAPNKQEGVSRGPPRMAARGGVPDTSTTSGPTTSRWTKPRKAGGLR
jgi:putative transposase